MTLKEKQFLYNYLLCVLAGLLIIQFEAVMAIACDALPAQWGVSSCFFAVFFGACATGLSLVSLGNPGFFKDFMIRSYLAAISSIVVLVANTPLIYWMLHNKTSVESQSHWLILGTFVAYLCWVPFENKLRNRYLKSH